jgi:hypothetical protein
MSNETEGGEQIADTGDYGAPICPKCIHDGGEWNGQWVPVEDIPEPEYVPDIDPEFYSGIEWFGAWLVDHVEGEILTEELIHRWACEAWKEHLEKQNTELTGPEGPVQ